MMFSYIGDELTILEQTGHMAIFKSFTGKTNEKVCGNPAMCAALADWLEEQNCPRLAHNWRVRMEMEQKYLERGY
jgi:NAD(P)H-flavin reductase